MGFGKTLVEDYTHIWSGDPALEEADDFAHRFGLYTDDGDESHLRFVSGRTPMRWTVRHIRRRIVRRILDTHAGKGQEAMFDACAFALVAVSGLKDDTGKDFHLAKERDDRGYERVTDDCLDLIDANFPGLVNEIGSLAIRKAMPDPKS